MSHEAAVSSHYSHGDLLALIRDGIDALGKTTDTIEVNDLGPVEEFHIGGREASQNFLDQLGVSADDHVLDAGCGLGGTSRFVAHRYGSRVTGIDLTEEYVKCGRVMNTWVGLDDLVTLDVGSITDLPYEDETFNKAYVIHVGMNIADKALLVLELYRVLAPGGRLGIYDVMRVGHGGLVFPVPWAAGEETSFVATPDEYKLVLEQTGFRVFHELNRRDFALTYFARVQAKLDEDGGPPPLGVHILMKETAPIKSKNVVENISAGRIAPVELIAEKTA